MPNLGLDGEENKPIKIAQTTFAFRNAKMINWLKKRGGLLQTEKWEKADEVVVEINENLKDGEFLDDL